MNKGSLERIAAICKASVNDLIDRFEDPEKMVRQLVRDMEDSVDRTVAAVGRAVAQQKRLERQREQYRRRVEEWQQAAERALETGDEPGARQALLRKGQVSRADEELEPALAESREGVEKLRAQLEELRARLQEARSRQGSLVARFRAAQGPEGQSESTGASRVEEVERRVRGHEADWARFEEKVEAATAEAELQRELAAARREERALEEAERQRQVEAELARLRGQTRKEG